MNLQAQPGSNTGREDTLGSIGLAFWIYIFVMLIAYISGIPIMVLGAVLGSLSLVIIGFAASYVSLIAFILGRRIRLDEAKVGYWRNWLSIHIVFNSCELLVMPIVFVLTLILLTILTLLKPSPNWTVVIFAAVFEEIFAISFFLFSSRFRNDVGLDFPQVEGGSLHGAAAFARLAKELHGSENGREARYIRISLTMLGRALNNMNVDVPRIFKLARLVSLTEKSSSRLSDQEVEYLTKALSNSTDPIATIPDILNFDGLQHLMNERRIKIGHGILHPRSIWIPLLVTAFGAGAAWLQALLPEAWKSSLVSATASLASFDAVGLTVIVILYVIWVYYLDRVATNSVVLGDARRIIILPTLRGQRAKVPGPVDP